MAKKKIMVSATDPNPKPKNAYHIGGLEVEFPYQHKGLSLRLWVE